MCPRLFAFVQVFAVTASKAAVGNMIPIERIVSQLGAQLSSWYVDLLNKASSPRQARPSTQKTQAHRWQAVQSSCTCQQRGQREREKKFLLVEPNYPCVSHINNILFSLAANTVVNPFLIPQTTRTIYNLHVHY